MTYETYSFIVSLFVYYQQTLAGLEPDNAEALSRAWDEIDALQASMAAV